MKEDLRLAAPRNQWHMSNLPPAYDDTFDIIVKAAESAFHMVAAAAVALDGSAWTFVCVMT
jgi:hypothetical protein